MSKDILDPCCGSRMFWFDKEDDRAVFGDRRAESHILCDGRTLNISPDIVMDFTSIPYDDETFNLVVFDPPHLMNAGKKSWLAKKYGVLQNDWKKDISAGFSECFRVLKPSGVLIFKWCEVQISVNEILSLTDEKPLFGHRSGKASNTHWITFMKESQSRNMYHSRKSVEV